MSLTRLGRKRKLPIQEPIDTAIIRAQKNFETVGGLNSIQIEIDNDRVMNLLKRYKNVSYRLTPLGILFPASLKNDTEQIFITSRELNDVKKELINSEIYRVLRLLDLKKISNWSEIKAQSIWINVTLVEQKEINNSRHLHFPFPTKTLNDLLSFSICLIDDDNNEIAFTGEKKISILNFKIDGFLQ